MPGDRLLKTMVLGMMEGERQPGRPARRWIDVLMWCDKYIKAAVMMTEVRENWRRFVSTGEPYTVLVTTGFGERGYSSTGYRCVSCNRVHTFTPQMSLYGTTDF